MPVSDPIPGGAPPSRAVSIAVAAALVALWGLLRVVFFETSVIPLAYALPLLIGVWTRDRLALWLMAAAFGLFHTVKLFWILPEGVLPPGELWANYGLTLVNIAVTAAAVHLIIRLRERLERAVTRLRAQADELHAQREELAQQNEELTEQAEELSQQAEELAAQGEELASQNEELQSQAEEITTLNAALERRQHLLQTLLETARQAGSEGEALQHIAAAALDLFGGQDTASAVYEQAQGGLQLRALAQAESTVVLDDDVAAVDGFVSLVLHEGRTAGLEDASMRPDLRLAPIGGRPPFAAALGAPIRVADGAFGAFVVYAGAPRQWLEEEFRLAEWLADQCGRVLQTLRLQSDLRDADRRKSEFLATLSHELRNPLAPIGFALELIENGDRPDGHAVRVMRRQLRQLVRLVDDLLDATRLASNKVQVRKTRLDLGPVVQQAVEASMPEIQAARHTTHVALPAEPVWVDADADRIAQVVTNLLSNATRYTPAGGRLGLTLTAGEGYAVLSVSDSGVGLERGDAERVFEMFTQVGGPGSGGLGIGLALVKGIVELHGGRVEAHSEGPGRGSEFRVVLPLAEAPAGEVPPGSGQMRGRGAGARVLVVDDNRDSAEMMATLLQLHGHTVRVEHDAQAALDAVREFQPDAALLDIGLPRIDGYELAKRLRSDPRTRNVRLVAVTGWGMDGDRARAHEAGFDAHLTKPVEPRLILTAIDDAVL